MTTLRILNDIVGSDMTAEIEDDRDRVASGGCPPEAPTDPNVRN